MAAYKIYISSTYRDLIEDRAQLRSSLDKAQYETVCMEKYPTALSQNIKQKCEDDVSKCDIYICIVGDKYGSLAKDENGNQLDYSYTEYEYDAAVRNKRKRLVFFKETTEEKEEKLTAFVNKIRAASYFTGKFKEAGELPTQVLIALAAETGQYIKRQIPEERKYFCNRFDQSAAFDKIFYQQRPTAKIHFFLLPGHEFNAHTSFIDRYMYEFKRQNNEEEQLQIVFNVKVNIADDETKIRETIKERISVNIKSKYEDEQLAAVNADELFAFLQRQRKKILVVAMNIESSFIKPTHADMYKKSIEKFFNDFTTQDDPANEDKKIIFFLNLKYTDTETNFDVLKTNFENNPFYDDKKLPTLTKVNADDLKEWLEFNDIEKNPVKTTRLLADKLNETGSEDAADFNDEGIYMAEALVMMEAIINLYNQKTV
jgi:hypothetical protein